MPGDHQHGRGDAAGDLLEAAGAGPTLVKIAKSLSWLGRRPRRARRIAVSSSISASKSSGRLGTVAMWMVSPPPFLTSRELLVEGGDRDGHEVVVAAAEEAEPLFSKRPITR